MGFFHDKESKNIKIGSFIWIIVAAVIFGMLVSGSFRVVGPEEVGVRVTLGKVSKEPAYGLSAKWPLISKFVKFEKTTQRVEVADQTYTQDIQPATIKYVFTYRIVSANAPDIYLTYGKGYEEKTILPTLHSSMKAVIGKWTATDLVSNRDSVARLIEADIQNQLSSEYFTDVRFAINDIDYSDAFEKGIEEKVLAEQEAQKAKNKTVQIEEEARQQVIKAKADANAEIAKAEGRAKAMDIEGAALRRNPQYLELKDLENKRTFAESMTNLTHLYISGGEYSDWQCTVPLE